MVAGNPGAAKARDFTPIVISYVLCVAAALAVLYGVVIPAPWDALAADVAATVVIFAFSYVYKNSSFYDPYWSVIPPLLAVWWYCVNPEGFEPTRAMLVMILVWLWAIRLTGNWATHWDGLSHEDWRYPIVRQRAGKFATIADFAGIHLYPTFQVFAGCLPIYFVMAHGKAPLNWLDAVAAIVTFGAIAIETIADLQLHAFIKTKKPGDFIKTGLWAWSRHPNYFGEVSFWWGLLLFGLAASPENWAWIIPGAISMSCMFAFASIPFMDERSKERRPAYGEYMKKTSALVLMPPKK